MFTRAIRTSLFVAAATTIPVTSAHAIQNPPGTLRPVQPMRSAPKPSPATAQTTTDQSFKLQWRRSGQVAPSAQHAVGTGTRPETSAVLRTASSQSAVPSAGTMPKQPVVRQAAWQDDGAFPPRLANPTKANPNTADPWNDPFGDGSSLTRTQAAQDPPPRSTDELTLPEMFEAEPGPATTNQIAPPPLGADSTAGPETNLPETGQGVDATPPLDADNLSIPPASDAPANNAPATDAEAAELLVPPAQTDDSPSDAITSPFPPREEPAPRPSTDSSAVDLFPRGELAAIDAACDERRQALLQKNIRQVSLDIAAPFRPDLVDKEDFDRELANFLDSQADRVWRNYRGEKIAEGRFVDLAYESVVIVTADEEELLVPLSQLGDADLGYIAAEWGLPAECRLPQTEFKPREWLPVKMTWKASELCHKPLYFEEVNLERYGHTAGPIAQPVVSTAHFFVNIATLPYQMGIHPPTECQYALGYYRPGNCAPWIIPPVPLSLRGAMFQTAAIGAGIGLIP